jgi:hypothetical protein
VRRLPEFFRHDPQVGPIPPNRQPRAAADASGPRCHVPGLVPDDFSAIRRPPERFPDGRGRPRDRASLLCPRGGLTRRVQLPRNRADPVPRCAQLEDEAHDSGFALVDVALHMAPLPGGIEHGRVLIPNSRRPVTWPARAFRTIASAVRCCRAFSRSSSSVRERGQRQHDVVGGRLWPGDLPASGTTTMDAVFNIEQPSWPPIVKNFGFIFD